jgi:HD superfamily phosphohydrolase
MDYLEKQWSAQANTSLSQEEMPFTEEEKRSVVLAGLMHDAGHGIHSHLFDRSVIKGILNSQSTRESVDSMTLAQWTHEEASTMMI